MPDPTLKSAARTPGRVVEPAPSPADVDASRFAAADPLLCMSIEALVDGMCRRVFSPVDLLEAHISRMEAVNPLLTCLVAERFGAAREEAAAAGREYATSASPRPLLGIPFTVKEMIEVAGMPLTFGSAVRRGRTGARDATVVARLRRAGAIPLGVTNVPEWGMWFESYNALYGRTNNPYNLQHTPGGSSGGEGAAVGSGASVFGIGSDIGGSVRMPAAFCGVYGHKPTTGLLPLTGHYPVYSDGPDAAIPQVAPYVSIGTLTRSAGDIARLIRAMAGRDGIDPNAEPLAFLNPQVVDWRDRRVLLLSNPQIEKASAATADVGAAVTLAGRLLEERGAQVSDAPEKLLQHAGDIWFSALQSVGGASFAEILTEGRGISLELEIIRALVGRSRYSWPALFFCIGERIGRKNERALRSALREGRRLALRYRELVGRDAILVSPVHPRTAPRHNGAIMRPFDFLYTAVFNALRVPATTAPCGFDASGLPLSVQFTSARGNDHVTIAAASVVEAGMAPWRPAPVATTHNGRGVGSNAR
ncbi:MAG TPA: amidase [Longimicrobiales bacterium]|nr:amidase [Longimicrobiales bacterium]